MLRFGPMSWHSSARLIALASWVLAIALTGSMGWQAWTSIRQATGSSSYGTSQGDTAITVARPLSRIEIIAYKNRSVG
ncbi:hypothetical protein [Maricaulis sp.]|uniref:hypothetical protein n=1 Tax=Maricaulis sp. TaxID=1486257 RepID=UPI003A952962